MNGPLLVILMGSVSDKQHCLKIADAAGVFGLNVELRIGSAHKTAPHLIEILDEYTRRDQKVVFITVAGLSNALSGFVDGYVNSPVIACPPPSDRFGGMDVFSSLRMPSGIAPALVLEPKNAALLAAKIFALSDEVVAAKVAKFKQEQIKKVLEDDQEMQLS